ncbi:SH3 domain-containing kinase-binding 1-like [Paramuricea clavata]|nr:SH3 domain-containing kinase-binding 1-like [Paramuricea clavata]
MFPENFVEEIKKPVETKNTEVKPVPDKNVVNEKSSMAKVTFDYEAENNDELTLKEGDMVKVLDQEEEGWWKGELNGKIGVFPSNFVELVKGPPPSTAEPQPERDLPKEPATGEKKAKMMGGLGLGLTQDALSKVKLRKSPAGGGGNNIQKPEKPSEPSELPKRLSMKRNPPKIPESDKPPKAASKGKERAVVEFEYEGEQNDELTLHVGDVVTILEKDVNEGWSKGELNGKIGLFPDNFVKLLPPEQPKKEPEAMTKSKSTSDLSKKPPLPVSDDSVDAKPNRPEFPKLKKTNTDRPPPPSAVNQTEIPVKLKPVGNPLDDITKKSEPPPLPDSKPSGIEDRPKPPIKKSPPSLPKKPDKPKPPQDLPVDRPLLKHVNGVDPTKRHSTPFPPTEKAYDVNTKRHSHGADLGVNLNDIKSSAVLHPLTSDRPKNPAKNPPTKYGKPHSPKKTVAPEIPHTTWPPKEEREARKPMQERPIAAEKPPKPAIPEMAKPSTKPSEPKVDSAEVKKLHDEINTLKNTLESFAKQFKEHVQKSEKQLQKMEKKFTDEIEDLTRELDEEKKLRSAVDVEVNRLRKLIKNQVNS